MKAVTRSATRLPGDAVVRSAPAGSVPIAVRAAARLLYLVAVALVSAAVLVGLHAGGGDAALVGAVTLIALLVALAAVLAVAARRLVHRADPAYVRWICAAVGALAAGGGGYVLAGEAAKTLRPVSLYVAVMGLLVLLQVLRRAAGSGQTPPASPSTLPRQHLARSVPSPTTVDDESAGQHQPAPAKPDSTIAEHSRVRPAVPSDGSTALGARRPASES